MTEYFSYRCFLPMIYQITRKYLKKISFELLRTIKKIKEYNIIKLILKKLLVNYQTSFILVLPIFFNSTILYNNQYKFLKKNFTQLNNLIICSFST